MKKFIIPAAVAVVISTVTVTLIRRKRLLSRILSISKKKIGLCGLAVCDNTQVNFFEKPSENTKHKQN